MSREIKFRAYDKKKKEMFKVRALVLDDEGKPSELSVEQHETGAYWDLGIGDVELMQYTGLKDKNGKEIYDGDIIKVHFGEWVEYEPEMHGGEIYDKEIVKREARDYIGEVRWRVVGGTGFIVKELENRWFRFNKKKTSEGTEVTGNIYEHPELLKENK